IRDGKIEQMSFDHSLVWEMARRQRVDPEGLAGIPSNVIVRSLGPEPLVQVDLEGPHPIAAGDVYLFLSGGLCGRVSDAEIGAGASVLPPAEACRFLVDLANLRGGPDNITVLVVRVKAQGNAREPKAASAWPVYLRVSWPMTTLVAGVLLVILAAYLTAYEHRTAGIASFLLAAPTIVAGITGLMISYSREQRRQAEQTQFPPPRMYREADCRVDRHLIEKLTKANSALEQQIKEKQWQVEWLEYQQHFAQGIKFLGEEKLTDGFRELCRAMRVLADTFQ